MIYNSYILSSELNRIENNFITVKIHGDDREDDFIIVKDENDREYIIDSIAHSKNYTDSPSTHLCLLCKDGGQGEIKR